MSKCRITTEVKDIAAFRRTEKMVQQAAALRSLYCRGTHCQRL